MESIRNFRELAKGLTTKDHHKIKEHMIFRSGELSQLNDDDHAYLKSLKMGCVYELRSLNEQKLRPSKADLNTISFDEDKHNQQPMDDEFMRHIIQSGPSLFMENLYSDYLPCAPFLKPLFQNIINQHEPFLFHCASGKDRTGIVGALLMFILGFSFENIKNEFSIIDCRLMNETEIYLREKNKYSEDDLEKLRPMHTIDPKYMQIFFESIEKKYQSMDRYIQVYLGIEEEQMIKFRKRYLV